VTFSTIAAAVQNTTATTGKYDWVVTGPLTKLARIRISAAANPSITDISNVNFQIANAFIKLSVPKAGANWGYGTTQEQRWTTNLGPSDKVSVLYTDGGPAFTLLKSNIDATAKKTTIVVPTLGAAVNTARMRVQWANPPAGQPAVQGTSPAFTIAPPFVNVIAPAASEMWIVGTKKTILWEHNLGTLEKVRIDLSKDDGATFPIPIVTNSKSDGRHAVTVQSAWGSQTTTRIRIRWMADAAVAHTSAAFTIQQ
jgi:hypothetical protein